MTGATRACLVLAALVALAGCGTSGGTAIDCSSYYIEVGRGHTWPDLVEAVRADRTRWGVVASVRVQARGHDVGVGGRRAVRVIDLLDRHGKRLIQADVWRTPDGGWRAGVWSQCIDGD